MELESREMEHWTSGLASQHYDQVQVIVITLGTISEKINFYLLIAFTSDLTHWKPPIAYILFILMPKTTYIISKASKIGPNKWKIIKNGLKFYLTKKSSLYVPV